MQSLRSIKELEYSLTLRTRDTNAANIVAINRYQYVRLLPARVGSAYDWSVAITTYDVRALGRLAIKHNP